MGGYGSDRSDRYVATYKLSHSKDGLTWVEYRENGLVKVSGLSHFRRGGGVTPIYGLYRYVPRDRVCFLRFSILKWGIISAHVA